MQSRGFIGSCPALAAFFPTTALMLSVGCGSGKPAAPSGGDPGSGGSSSDSAEAAGTTSGVELALDGMDERLSGAAQLEVKELNPVVNLVVTTVYASNQDNLLQLHLALDGVQHAMGFHHSEFGVAANTAALAVAYLDQVSYSAHSGVLEVTLTKDGTIDGRFDALLSADPAPGSTPAPAPSEAPAAPVDFEISGTFSGIWSLVCRSPVLNLPGDHSVSNSPYCQRLEF